MLITVITVIHIVACVFLAAIVLLQHGKGADMGATFGSGTQSVFGATGATTILQKLTTGAAVTFMITSLSLTYLSSRRATGSLMESTSTPTPSPTPTAAGAVPGATAVPGVEAFSTPAPKAETTPSPLATPAK